MSTKNLKIIRPNQKLDHKKIGFFFIKKQKGKLNYKLDLPKEMKIHPVFYISLLEPANPETPVSTKLSKLSSENEYEVEKIIDYDHKSQQYFVKWEGYDNSENIWESKQYLEGCRDKLQQYRKRK